MKIEVPYLKSILDERYKECNSEGHKSVQGDSCVYCYRHLEYSAPRTEDILKDREKLPWYSQPMDGTIMIEKRKKEINRQKFLDRLRGLRKLSQELEVANELEKKLQEAGLF